MKNLLLVLTLSLVAFVANSTAVLADSYDSDTATIKKSSDSVATVMIGSKTYTAPISFADGASWDVVKDHYEVSPEAEALFDKKSAAISIGADGTASFSMKSHKK